MMITAHTLVSAALAIAVAAPAARRPPSRIDAATAADSTVLIPRLTVRPRTMATGTRTKQAGLIQLDGLPGYYVYVPEQAVGTRRVPLLVLLHGGRGSGRKAAEEVRGLADKYGMIVLCPSAADPGHWDVLYHTAVATDQSEHTATGTWIPQFPTGDLSNIDAAMKLVLRTYAIDPNRVALHGFSDGGGFALLLGRNNPDVFSRVAALSATVSFDGKARATPQTHFFVSGGIAEGMAQEAFKMAQVLRRAGYTVVTQLGLRGHVNQTADEDIVWRWMIESWKDPSVTRRLAAAPADSDPVLTVEAVQQMTDFWTRLKQEPDSIMKAGRMAHQRSYALALGAEPVTVVMTDLPAFAAKYPSVAADLKAAGLTPT